MKRGKFESQPVAKKNSGKKIVSLLLVLVLLLGTVIGTTLAWLIADTDTITNTFVVGNINLTLEEPAGAAANYQFKMTPGASYTKDPKVTVEAGSEDCWLFVKVDVVDTASTLEYEIDTSVWTAVADHEGLYAKKIVGDAAKGVPYGILVGNTVSIKDTSDGTTSASMAFTAYAIQSAELNTEDTAVIWGYLNGQLHP